MPLKLEEITSDADFEELVECEWIAWENPPQNFHKLICPIFGTGPDARAESLKEATTRQLSWHRGDPTSHWLKVTDVDTGKIVAGALWKIFESNPFEVWKPSVAYWWPEGDKRDFVSQALDQASLPRRQLAARPHLYLNVAFTLPEYRRQGAGNMFMEWGTKKADEMGLETWIDSTPLGEGLYQKHGFLNVRDKELQPKMENPSKDWKQMEVDLLPLRGTLMWRPVGGQTDKGS